MRFDLRSSDDEYMKAFEGSIHEDSTGAEVGHITAYSVDMHRAFEDGQWLPLLFSGALAPYMLLFDPEQYGEFTSALNRLLDVDEGDLDWERNVLIIDRVEILPSYRGRDYGLQAIHTVLRKLCTGHRIAALKPFPLQCEPRRGWNESLNLATFPQDEQTAIRRLAMHYQRLQFRPLPETELLVLDLAPRQQWIEWDEVPGVELGD